MRLSPDQTIFWQNGFVVLNATIVWTWVIMILLVFGSILITRKLQTGNNISRWQCLLEILVKGMSQQIGEVGIKEPRKYLGFLGTLFVFIASANICIIFPGYEPPTASLSTTAALSFSVLLAVPYFGISKNGFGAYLKSYLQPTFIMLPFNIISEVSRTIALAVRLFGNIMSGGMIVAILLTIAPLVFPVIMNLLGLLTGLVQAYIFSILAAVYIASATTATKKMKTIPLKIDH